MLTDCWKVGDGLGFCRVDVRVLIG